jgi:oligoendopeptidase F
MMNFSGSFGDVLTLAHEFGHAYHGHSLKDVTYLNSKYSMPIAEVASTFCETLICEAAMKTATTAEKQVILENNIQGMAQIIVDIYSRYIFESEFIAERENGSLSVDEIKEIMVSAQQKAYGEGLEDNHPYMWVCKPHYYYVNRNFYNFPYAYGLLFAKGLYGMYLNEGESFTGKYKDLLTATGCNSLYEVGKIVDIDVRKKEFWKTALDVIIDEIEQFILISV